MASTKEQAEKAYEEAIGKTYKETIAQAEKVYKESIARAKKEAQVK